MNKKVAFHIDDIWSSISSNRAAFDLLNNNFACSWSVMVPWKWFSDAMNTYKKNPELDLWIHLTLNSEWRWDSPQRGPTLPTSQTKSLIDSNWKFYQTLDEVFEKASYEEIKKELVNQIEIALKTWLNFSHLDAHMWIILHKKLFWVYKELVELFWIPPFICYPKEGDSLWNWFYWCEKQIKDLEQKWYKCFNNFDANSPNEWEKSDAMHIKNRIENIRDWTTYFLLHVMPQHIHYEDHIPDEKHRQSEYSIIQSEEIQWMIKEKNIQKSKVVDILNKQV